MPKKKVQFNQRIFLGLVIALAVIYALNIFLTYSTLKPLNTKLEEQKPADLFLTIIKNDCEDCFDMYNIVALLRQRTEVMSEKEYVLSSQEAKILIDRHDLKTLPALIITGEIDKPTVTALWESLGVEENNNAIVIQGIPPYYDLSSGKVVGLVQLTYLTDNSCVECYDVEINQQILTRLGISIKNALSYDVSSTEGKKLIEKYDITKVPIILLSPDAGVYNAFVDVWDQVGSLEADGWFVMRNPEVIGTYRDLSTGKIVNATSA